VEEDAVIGLTIRTPDGQTDKLFSEAVVDASGCATFLANHRVTGKKEPGSSDKPDCSVHTIREHGATQRAAAFAATRKHLLYYQTRLLGLVHPGE
jgi:hypothetical protein